MKNMKKMTTWLCVLAIALLTCAGSLIIAQASSVNEQECDTVFFKALERVLTEENVTEEKIEIEKEPLYDIALNPLGYLYAMEIGADDGFAIVVKAKDQYDVTEMYLNSSSPYNGYDGLKIYVSAFMYVVHSNGTYIETSSGAVLDEQALKTLSKDALYGTDDPTHSETEKISYTNKVSDKYEMAKQHPAYLPYNIPANGCTPTAGANIIGYYTRYFPQLIPGFTPGIYFGNFYLYYQSSDEITPVLQTLYNYMGTNNGEAGTTIAAFRSGMTSYCREKGLSIDYKSNMRNGGFDYASAKQNFRSGLPGVVFVDTFTVTEITPKESSDYLFVSIGTQCHAMACFGYEDITYTLSNGQTRTDRYMAVATGLPRGPKGYFNINYKTQIDEMYSISIF